jgi:hypothetical protein
LGCNRFANHNHFVNQLSSTIGKFPLLNRKFPGNYLHVIEDLLTRAEIEFDLEIAAAAAVAVADFDPY